MSSPPTLDSLRREIDAIDDQIHGLLIRRTEIVERIAAFKTGDNTFLRPAREAMILRRLAARHRGRFPLPVLVRIWREMIAAFCRIQGPFAIAVTAPTDTRGLWDVARDHYGSATPITAMPSAMQALRAVAAGRASVAVVPLPDDIAEGEDPWWRALVSGDPTTPRIVDRLPILAAAGGEGERGALGVARLRPEPTGDDHAYLVVELAEDMSRGRLKDHLDAAGLPPVAFWSRERRPQDETTPVLLEIADFVAEDDARLGDLADRLGSAAQRIVVIGAYALPVRDAA
ncbi:MAG: chorismate mutase [Azospirillaceae bacterium]